jgi:receptor protein-tyrosine kinase
VTPAAVPSSPTSPKTKRNAGIGLGAGLAIGLAFALIIDYFDDSIESKEELERAVPGLPVLGLIPAVRGWKNTSEPQVVSLIDPNSASSEAYRTLRTSIQFLGLDHPLRKLQITSPSAAEGKTTTLANMGVTLSRAGRRVTIVDCDLRRPRIHDFFGLSNERGFTSVLLGDLSFADAVQRVPGEDHLSILASGPTPPNPSELIVSRRASEVLDTIENESDMVLVDCPPVLPVTDAAALSALVDATLLVCGAGETTRKELSRALEVLGQVGAPIVGVVLNGVHHREGYGYSYRYGYRYRYDQTDGKPPSDPRTLPVMPPPPSSTLRDQ